MTKFLNIKTGLVLMLMSVFALKSSAECKPVIIPIPAQIDVTAGVYVPVEKVTVNCDDPSAAGWVKNHLQQWYGDNAPEVKGGKTPSGLSGEEDYTLTIDEKGVVLGARTIKGVRWGLYSLRQVAMAKRQTLTVEGYIAPKMTVKDTPKSSFRGMHICWFKETKAWEVERLIRLAAYYKMNYAVIESWGTFRSEVAPWYGWPDGEMTKTEIARLKGIADDLGITLIPQLNVFGHATGSRGSGGKHAILDISPEYQSLFEPLAGWNWCLTNPETRKVLISLLKEMHDAFGKPPYVHIGGDEAAEPSCPDCCARPYSEILLDHLSAIDKAVNEMGARAMMWHDMLLERGDKRWEGFYDHGTKETAKAALTLPKDIIMCDWYYGQEMPTYPTLSYFKDLGYTVLTCPWINEGMRGQIKYAQSHGMDGVLATLWNHYFGDELRSIYCQVSCLMWFGDDPAIPNRGNVFYNHLRQMGWDMKLKDHKQFGIFTYDVQTEPMNPHF